MSAAATPSAPQCRGHPKLTAALALPSADPTDDPFTWTPLARTS